MKVEPEEDIQIIKDMLELSIKSGRRLMHDFKHLLDELPKDSPVIKIYQQRAEFWESIFYPDKGMKNYLTQLHIEIRNLEVKLSVAEDKIKELE